MFTTGVASGSIHVGKLNSSHGDHVYNVTGSLVLYYVFSSTSQAGVYWFSRPNQAKLFINLVVYGTYRIADTVTCVVAIILETIAIFKFPNDR